MVINTTIYSSDDSRNCLLLRRIIQEQIRPMDGSSGQLRIEMPRVIQEDITLVIQHICIIHNDLFRSREGLLL